MPSDRPVEEQPVEMRVLLLPPTSRDAQAMCKVLGEAGINCMVCANMQRLCSSLREGAGAVIVSEEEVSDDATMLAECIGEQPVWSDVPVVVLSRAGIELPRLAPILGTLGNVSVLERPLRITTLVSVVRSALRARERQYQVRSHLAQMKQAEAALLESEGRFRQLAEMIPQLAWMAKPNGDIFWYNRRWYEYTGTTAEQMVGWGWQEVHDGATLPLVLERWRRSIATGERFEMELPLRGADGTFRWFLTRVVPLRDADGKIAQWFGTNTDIEAQRRIGEERARLLEIEQIARYEAERAGQMKDEFLATLGHELRTPLNAILGWAQIVKSNPGDASDVAEGIDVIERNARAQTQIIEDLLDMSRIISGKVRLDVQRVDLASAIEAAVETVRPAADARGVRLQTVLDPHAGKISGDPSRLQQIFWNLISNSVKFSHRGGVVQIVLARVNSNLEVSVADRGEGIKAEFLPHVFERFRQADASTTRRHGGLGLGLSIVKQLVELHGGQISAKSAGEGKGATFTVTLPQTAVQPEPAPTNPSAPEPFKRSEKDMDLKAATAAARDSLRGLKILVVDDEADARAMVKRVLEDCEAQVVMAASAAEAIQLFKQDRPQIIVSDIGMPVEDGYAMLSKIRKLAEVDGGEVPAVALTAYARSQDRTEAMLAGFQTHVAKPVNPSELIVTIASLANRKGPSGDL